MVIEEIKDVMNAKNDNKESIKFNKDADNYAIKMEIVIKLQKKNARNMENHTHKNISRY